MLMQNSFLSVHANREKIEFQKSKMSDSRHFENR